MPGREFSPFPTADFAKTYQVERLHDTWSKPPADLQPLPNSLFEERVWDQRLSTTEVRTAEPVRSVQRDVVARSEWNPLVPESITTLGTEASELYQRYLKTYEFAAWETPDPEAMRASLQAEVVQFAHRRLGDLEAYPVLQHFMAKCDVTPGLLYSSIRMKAYRVPERSDRTVTDQELLRRHTFIERILASHKLEARHSRALKQSATRLYRLNTVFVAGGVTQDTSIASREWHRLRNETIEELEYQLDLAIHQQSPSLHRSTLLWAATADPLETIDVRQGERE